MALFVLCLVANLVWMALEGQRGFGPWMLFNGALLVVLVLGQALLLLTCLAVASWAERAGRDGLALQAFRAGAALAGRSGFGFRVSEMAMRTRLEDYAGADALWKVVEPELARPEHCATFAVGVRAAALINRGRLEEGLALTATTDDSEKIRRGRDFPVLDALRLGNRASALIGLGRFEEAGEALARARELAGGHAQVGPVLRLNAAWLALHEGRPDEALAAAREAVAADGDRLESGWVLLLARLGRADEVEPLLKRPLGGRVAPAGTVRGRYVEEMTRGLAAWTRGLRDEAARHFEAAAALPTPPGEEMLEAWRLVGSDRLLQALRERSPESVWAGRALDQGGATGPEGILAP